MGEKMETVTEFIFWAPKSLQIVSAAMKLRPLLLGRKSVTNLDSVLKGRHYFDSKCLYSQTYVLPIVMYGYESWTIKTAEHGRTDTFKQQFWRRLLRVPWTARRLNPEYSLEGLMLRLWYFGHLMHRANSLERTLMLGKIEGRKRRSDRGWDCWMASFTQWTRVWAHAERWWRTGKPGVLQSKRLQRVEHNLLTEQQQQS